MIDDLKKPNLFCLHNFKQCRETYKATNFLSMTIIFFKTNLLLKVASIC